MSDPRIGNIAVLGSSGSIGEQTLSVVRENPGKFQVVALAANRDVEKVAAQVTEFKPQVVAMCDPEAARELSLRIGERCRVVAGVEGVLEVSALEEVHSVVVAIVGFAGLEPVLEAVNAGKHVALANKEALVAGGSILRAALKRSDSMVVPVDSEHSSIFQCLRARKDPIRKIILTATGGPFLNFDLAQLGTVTVEQAVKHPIWSMGAKISIDSASLMNKGLEVIEAAELFELSAEQIEVIVHPQALIHGLVEYLDGSVLAAMFESDMRVPICYALTYLRSTNPKKAPGTERITSGAKYLDLVAAGQLEFFAPDTTRFPSLALCFQALRSGSSMPAVLNAANEIAVERFAAGELGFMEIPQLVAEVMQSHQRIVLTTTEQLYTVDSWARNAASNSRRHPCATGFHDKITPVSAE